MTHLREMQTFPALAEQINWEAESRALGERLDRMRQHLRVLQLAADHAETFEDWLADRDAAQELRNFATETTLRLERVTGKFLRETSPGQRRIFTMIMEGGEPAKIALQALDDSLQEFKQEQGCEPQEVQA